MFDYFSVPTKLSPFIIRNCCRSLFHILITPTVLAQLLSDENLYVS